MKDVYILTTGDGSDGNEWWVHGIFSTRALAEAGREEYLKVCHGPVEIEEWTLDVLQIPVRASSVRN